MTVFFLLDKSLKVEIFYDPADRCYKDNICLRIRESCPDEERLFRADETNIYITPAQAQRFARALCEAANCSSEDEPNG